MQRRFPDPDTPLLVCCSDGGHDSEDAMADLLEAGYFNVVQLGWVHSGAEDCGRGAINLVVLQLGWMCQVMALLWSAVVKGEFPVYLEM